MQKALKLKSLILLFLAVSSLSGYSIQAFEQTQVTEASSSTVLETERTILRPATVSDTQALLAILADPVSVKMCEQDFNEEEVTNILLAPPYDPLNPNWEMLNFAVVLKLSQEVIGLVQLAKIDLTYHTYGLSEKDIDLTSGATIGYATSRKYWNQGYATEGVRRITEFAFQTLGLKQLLAETIHTNISSQKVLIHAGFEKTGEGKTSIGTDGLFFGNWASK